MIRLLVILTLLIMKSYVDFSLQKLIVHTYLPVMAVVVFVFAAPFLIINMIEGSLLRFIVNFLTIELIILFMGWIFVLKKEDKAQIFNLINKKIDRV